MTTTRTPRRWMVLAAALALLAAACGDDDDGAAVSPDDESATAENQPDPVEVDDAALQASLDQWLTEWDAYGATLSLRVPGHDDIHLASGIDDRDPDTPMPTDGTYGIASVTKTFVAALALQLVDEGKLALDEPVQAWLPELPHADQITLGMLLGHTAGFGVWDNLDVVLQDLTRSYTPEEALALNLQAPPVGQPGERFTYTNTGYTAVGLMIERVLHQDLATAIAQRFTEPLRLDDTQMHDGSVPATRHTWNRLAPDVVIDMLDIPLQASMTLLFAAGNIISSSEDLLDWGEALYSGDLLGPETTATMLDMRSSFAPDPANGQLVATDEPTRYHYGLGAMGYCLDPTGCDPDEVDLVGHSGSYNGYRTLLAYHPASGTTLAFFANWDFPYEKMLPAVSDLCAQLRLT